MRPEPLSHLAKPGRCVAELGHVQYELIDPPRLVHAATELVACSKLPRLRRLAGLQSFHYLVGQKTEFVDLLRLERPRLDVEDAERANRLPVIHERYTCIEADPWSIGHDRVSANRGSIEASSTSVTCSGFRRACVQKVSLRGRLMSSVPTRDLKSWLLPSMTVMMATGAAHARPPAL